MPVTVGTLQAILSLKDEVSDKYAKIETRLKTIEDRQKTTSKVVKNENDKIAESYRKVAASLDPVVANTQKYEKAEKALSNALKSGIISQDEYNKKLDQAKAKYTSLSPAIKDAEKSIAQLARTGRAMSTVGMSSTAAITVPLMLISGLSIKAARDFETSFAGVDKTVEGVTDSFGRLTREGAVLQKGLKDLVIGDKPIPIDINEVNRLAEAAGQLGIATSDILSFTHVMADLAVTTNLTSLEAADSIARFQNIFGSAGKDVDRFGSTLVALGNRFAATEKNILEMGVRIAAAGVQIKLTQGQVLAFATTLSSVGIEAEAGGSAISKVMLRIGLSVATGSRQLTNFAAIAGKSASEFADLFRKDAAGAITTFIEGLGKIKGEDAIRVLDEMGIREVRMRNALLATASAGDLLRKSLNIQKQAWEDNSELTEKAQKRYKTFDSQMKVFVNQLKDVGITLGTGLMPILRDMLSAVSPLIDKFKSLSEWFSGLDRTSKLIIGSFGGIAAGIGPVLIVSGKLIVAWTELVKFSPKIAAMAGPWGLVAIAIAGVTTATIYLIDKWKKASEQAIELNVRLGNLEGSATRFQIAMSKANGVLTKTQVIEAREITRQLAIELNEAQDRLDQIVKKLPSEQSKFAGSGIENAKKLTPTKEAALEVERLTKAYELQKKAIRGIKEVIDDTSASSTKSNKKVEGEIDIITAKEERAGDKSEKEAERRAKALLKLNKEHQEEIRYIGELQKLTINGPQNEIERLKAEEKINDEHEYRLGILKYEDQFSADIAKNLADQEKKLKLIDRQVKIDLKASIELTPIDIHPKILDEFNSIMKKTEDQLRDDIKTFDDFNNAQAEWLEGFASDWLEILEPTKVKTQKEIDAIRAAVKEGYFGSDAKEAAKKGAEAITIIQLEELDRQLTGWSSFMSDLGGLVGGGFGRIMSQVSQAIQSIQAGKSAGTQLGGLMNASAGTTALLGTVGTYVAVAKVAYDFFKSSQANRYSKGYGYAGVTSMDNGQWSIGAGMQGQARELSRQIQETAKSFVEAIGGSIKSFASIEIQVRRDGKYFKSFVQGEMIGKFEDVNEAVKAAIMAAFSSEKTKISGLSELVQQGLSQTLKTPELDLEDAQGFLSALKEISELSWSDSAKQVQSTVNHFHDLLQELFKVEQVTPAVLQGVQDIRESIVSTFEQWRRSITGQVESPEEERKRQEREMRLFNARKALEIANLKLEYESLQANKDILSGKANNTRQFFRIGLSELEGYGSFVQARGQLAQAEIEIYDGVADAIQAKLEAIAGIIAELENIPDIDISELGRGGRGNRGGNNDNKDSVKDFISNRKFELSLVGLSDYKKSLKELDRQYDDLIVQAGKDKKLKDELLALKERELALLREEEKKRVANDIKDFVLPTSEFRSIRETAKGLIDEINNSPFGDKRKAESIGLVLNRLNEEITRLSRESAKSLLGDMISDFEKFGLDNVQLTEMRKASAILEHMLSVENYRIRIETLRAEGNISAEILAMLDKSFAIISSVDISKWFDMQTANVSSYQAANDNLTETTNKVDDALNDLAESFKNAKDDIKGLLIDIKSGDLGIVSPMKSFDFIQNRYRDIINRAKGGDIVSYQESTEVTRDYIEALKKYKPSLAARELPNIERDLQSLLAMNQIHDDNVTYSEKFANNQDRTNKLLNSGFTGLTNVTVQQSDTQDQMLSKLSEINRAIIDQNQRLSQLESIKLGNKR